MATPEREREAAAVTRAFQAALTAQGVEVVAGALTSWQQVPPQGGEAALARWLEAVTRLVIGKRSVTRALGLAYYRLVRALRTGTTIGDSSRPESRYVSLSQLYAEFEAALEGRPMPAPQTVGSASLPDAIEVDVVFDMEQAIADMESGIEESIARSLTETGPASLDVALGRIDTDKPAVEVDAARSEALATAGSMQAASAQRQALNGGRGLLFALENADPKCIGWVRVSRTGTPCGFCAMLIARGFVLRDGNRTFNGYRSKAAAALNADGDKYHDNCNCIAEPVFSESQFDNNDLYELNRLYAKWWPEVTKGLKGRDALNAWRSWINRQNKINTPDQAQAA